MNLIKNLPTKEEFFDRMDKITAEYKRNDEAHTIQAGKLLEHEGTLRDLDKRHCN